MDLNKIGQYIAGKRKTLGLTQKQLAEKLGVSDKSVSKWERGVCLPDVSLYTELCAALGIGINEFISGEDIAENDLPRRAEENILQAATDGKRRRKRLLWIVGALLVLSLAALSVIGVYLLRANRPENMIRPVEKESTEMQTIELLAGPDGAYMYRYTASDDFLSLHVYLTTYHFGKQVSKESWAVVGYEDIGSPEEGTILIVPDFKNFQVKLILAGGGSKLSASFPILEGVENRKHFIRAGVSIEDEAPITFDAEQPLLVLNYSGGLRVGSLQEFVDGNVSPINDYAYYFSLEFCKAE